MRFPWLQVDADFIAAHAGDLAAHLGISRREAIGLAVDLWTWALARASDDAPPDGVVTGTGAVPARLLAGSVQFTGAAELFAEALVACGLAVVIDNGFRLTGFDRYNRTWEKNRRRPGKKPAPVSAGSGAKPARKTQTQTQTQTQKKEEPPNPPSGGQVASSAPGHLADRVAAIIRAADSGWASWAWDATKERHLALVLIKAGNDEAELLRRLRIAVVTRFPRFRNLKSLADDWDAYGRTEPTGASPAVALQVDDEDEPGACEACGTPGKTAGWGEARLGYACGCQARFEASGLHYEEAAAWAANCRKEARHVG